MVCVLSIGSGGDGADPAIRGRARRVGHWRRTGLPIRQKSSSTGKPRPIRSPGRADASPLAAAPGEACRVPHGAERRARAGRGPARGRARARPQRKLDENHLESRRGGDVQGPAWNQIGLSDSDGAPPRPRLWRRFPGWTNGPAGLCLDPGACVLAHTDGRSTAADRDRAET